MRKSHTQAAAIAAVLAGTLGLFGGSAAMAQDAPATPAKPAKPAPAKNVSKEDIDLFAFSTVNALVPGKSVADFRALPNLVSEKRDNLSGTVDPEPEAPKSTPAATPDSDQIGATPAPAPPKPANAGPASVRFIYSDGVDLRVMDYGDKAFVTHLKINGPGHVVLDTLKIGATRDEVLAVLGRPSRGGGSYAIYEGKSDVIRVFYTPAGTLSSLEIDRGD